MTRKILAIGFFVLLYVILVIGAGVLSSKVMGQGHPGQCLSAEDIQKDEPLIWRDCQVLPDTKKACPYDTCHLSDKGSTPLMRWDPLVTIGGTCEPGWTVVLTQHLVPMCARDLKEAAR